jgi:hypothetical protein
MILKLERTDPMKHILSKHVSGLLMVRTASPRPRAPVLCRQRQIAAPYSEDEDCASSSGTQASAGIHTLLFRKTRSALPQIVCCVRHQSKLALPAL